MARSPLTETIARVNGMVRYVQENLNPDEYDLFLDLCVPEPEPEAAKPVKKKRKSSSKSPRASGMAAAINRNLRQRRDELPEQCAQELTNGGTCAFPEDHLIHDPKGGYSGYHPFVSPAPSAATPSSTNGVNKNVLTVGAGD